MTKKTKAKPDVNLLEQWIDEKTQGVKKLPKVKRGAAKK